MYLQAAVDCPTAEDTVNYLCELRNSPEIKYVEIGTPIITHFGIQAVDLFAKYIECDRLYADLKSIDFPIMEITPYLNRGITKYSIMAFMNDAVLGALATFAQNNSLDIFVSTMGYPLFSLAERVNTLVSIGFSSFICHGSGLTTQDAFTDMIARLRLLASVKNINLIAAGGINRSNARLLRGSSCCGLIVGRGLRSELNVSIAAREILFNVQ